MPSHIDHVIIAAPDLNLLEDAFTRLGFSVSGGGTHPHLGTRNRIIVLGDGYIELLAVADTVNASPVLRERIAHGAGWVGYALQSDDITRETQIMRERGVDARGPIRGRLVSPDGATRSWQVVTLGSDDLWEAAYPLPFLIQHDSAGEQHQRELAGADGIRPHSNGAHRLVGVELLTTTFASLREQYDRAFALPIAPRQPDDADTARKESITYQIGASREWIRLVQPANAVPEVSLTTGAASVMAALVGVADLQAVERAVWNAGFAATTHGAALRVTIPGVNADVGFTERT
ncbi:MAG TPA: VOC family protein [Ktedonobacterales bacterium]